MKKTPFKNKKASLFKNGYFIPPNSDGTHFIDVGKDLHLEYMNQHRSEFGIPDTVYENLRSKFGRDFVFLSEAENQIMPDLLAKGWIKIRLYGTVAALLIPRLDRKISEKVTFFIKELLDKKIISNHYIVSLQTPDGSVNDRHSAAEIDNYILMPKTVATCRKILKSYYKTNLEESDLGFDQDYDMNGSGWIIEPSGKIVDLHNNTHANYLAMHFKNTSNVEKVSIGHNYILIRDYGFKHGLVIDVKHLDDATKDKLKDFIQKYNDKIHAVHFKIEELNGKQYSGSIEDFYEGNFRRDLGFAPSNLDIF
jgi:hypothetical protein